MLCRALIRDVDEMEGICFLFDIRETMDERVEGELAWVASGVEHEVRSEEHEVGELVALAGVASLSTFIGKASQARARMEYLDFALIWEERGREVVEELINQLPKALFAFGRSLDSPLPHELLNNASHFDDVLEGDMHGGHLELAIRLLREHLQACRCRRDGGGW